MYEKLDERIVEAVREGCKTFSQIEGKINAGLTVDHPEFTPGRIIDRRLQSLRRQLRIKYTGSSRAAGWRINSIQQEQQA